MVELNEQLLSIQAYVIDSTPINESNEDLPIETIKVSEIECGEEVSTGVLTIDGARVLLS